MNIRAFAFLPALAACGLLFSDASSPAVAARALSVEAILGRWNIRDGRTPDGAAYSGELRIDREGDALILTWQTSIGDYTGAGFWRDGVLFASWGERGYGLAVYDVVPDGRTLDGRWTLGMNGSLAEEGGAGSETAKRTEPGDLEGNYGVKGVNPGGTGRYEGRLAVRRTGETYRAEWLLSGRTTTGVGLKERNLFGVAYGSGGVSVFVLEGGRLRGRWAVLGDSATGTEILAPAEN